MHVASTDLLVDTTSAGLAPASDAELADAVPLAALRSDAVVMSLVYHRPTELLRRAAARGLAVLDGRGMLVHQGTRAFGLWTGLAAPVDAMRAALDDSLA
jgi:shikimate dehydrogenase